MDQPSFGGTKGTTCDPVYGGQCGVVFELSPPKKQGQRVDRESAAQPSQASAMANNSVMVRIRTAGWSSTAKVRSMGRRTSVVLTRGP